MKKLKLLCDPLVSAMGLVWITVTPFFTAVLIYGIFIMTNGGIKNFSDLLMVIFLCLLPIAVWIITIFCIPIWFASIEIDAEGIRLNKVFSKKAKVSYEECRFFQVAYYNHIYNRRYFVVISSKPVSLNQLVNINCVRNSEELIKIKLTKGRYRKLCQILPTYYREKLERAINGKEAVNIEKILKMQKRKHKQKRKTNNK